MTRRYVVGFDGSGPSEAALAWAVHRAASTPAPLILCHVAEGDAGDMGRAFEEDALRRGSELISQRVSTVRDAHPELQVDGLVVTGSVAWELAGVASADDLLIVGTHKTGFLHGRVLGSRSVQIAIASVATVVVVPEVDLRFRQGVVAGIDRLETAEGIAELAADEAMALDTDVSLVEASPNPMVVQDLTPLSVAASAARRRYPHLIIRSRHSGRTPAEALLDSARDKALLVLGPGSADPVRSPIGSVLHDILLNVNAPVMIAPRATQVVASPDPVGVDQVSAATVSRAICHSSSVGTTRI